MGSVLRRARSMAGEAMSRTLVITDRHEVDGVPVASADMPSMAAQLGSMEGVVKVDVNNTAMIIEYEPTEDGKDPGWIKQIKGRMRLS